MEESLRPAACRLSHNATLVLGNRFAVTTESVLLAARFSASGIRTGSGLAAATQVIGFLSEMHEEMADFRRASGSIEVAKLQECLPVWSFELHFAAERADFGHHCDLAETLVRLLADAALWMEGLLSGEERFRGSEERFIAFLDSIATSSMQIVIGSRVALAEAA